MTVGPPDSASHWRGGRVAVDVSLVISGYIDVAGGVQIRRAS